MCLVDRILLFSGLLAGFHVLFADFCLVDSIIHFIGLLTGFYVLLFTSLLCWLDSLPYWLISSAHLQSSSPYWLDWYPHLFGLWPALSLLSWSVPYVADGQVCRLFGHQWDMFMMTRLVNLSKVLWVDQPIDSYTVSIGVYGPALY